MKKLLSTILCLSFILLMTNNCFAQKSPDKQQRGLHTVYAEALGNALFYSVGYDYTLKLQEKHKLSFKCGFGCFPESDGNGRLNFDDFIFSFAPEVSYLYRFSGLKHHLELGTGATYFANMGIFDWVLPFRIGYRYQKDNGGFFLKAAVTPLFLFWMEQETGNGEVKLEQVIHMPFGGVAVGYTFKSR